MSLHIYLYFYDCCCEELWPCVYQINPDLFEFTSLMEFADFSWVYSKAFVAELECSFASQFVPPAVAVIEGIQWQKKT